MPDDDAALQKKAANLVDYRGPFADEARPYPVQRLQIQLLIGLGWNKACRRPLHRLGYAMGISEIILVQSDGCIWSKMTLNGPRAALV